MIDNLWHLRGSAELPPNTSDDLIFQRLEAFLVKQQKAIVEHSKFSIKFSSPLWNDWQSSKSSWLALVVYDEGRFWIERGLDRSYLRYDLRSLHGLVFCLMGALLFFTFVSLSDGVAAGTSVALISFAWLYGANMVLAWTRIPAAIKRAVRGS